jgi:hypothetical protein
MFEITNEKETSLKAGSLDLKFRAMVFGYYF